jgi:hypothetical protein
LNSGKLQQDKGVQDKAKGTVRKVSYRTDAVYHLKSARNMAQEALKLPQISGKGAITQLRHV